MFVLVNGAVTWKYYVTNTGNVPLTNVTVVDNNGTASITTDDFTVCTITALAVGASQTCSYTGTNTTPAGTWYGNIGTASGSFTDGAGHSRTTTDTDSSGYYSGLPGAVTNSSLCGFGPNFRLVFTPDSRYYTSAYPAYKLSDSNPGQFFYNVFYTNTGGTNTIKMDIPYPFVTQGAMPVHVYSGLTVVQAWRADQHRHAVPRQPFQLFRPDEHSGGLREHDHTGQLHRHQRRRQGRLR